MMTHDDDGRCVDNFFSAAAAALEFAAAVQLRATRPDMPRPFKIPVNTAKGQSQRQVAKNLAAQAEAAKQKKGKKVSKKERAEYATIEAEVEALEAAAVSAQAALDEANSGKQRLSMNEKLDIASEASRARTAADKKMERYLELDELISEADGL